MKSNVENRAGCFGFSLPHSCTPTNLTISQRPNYRAKYDSHVEHPNMYIYIRVQNDMDFAFHVVIEWNQVFS